MFIERGVGVKLQSEQNSPSHVHAYTTLLHNTLIIRILSLPFVENTKKCSLSREQNNYYKEWKT